VALASFWAFFILTAPSSFRFGFLPTGDVTAQNSSERLFSSIVMLAGAIFYALVLGSVTNAISELSSCDQAMILKMKVADRFISRYNLDQAMANRLKQSTRLQGEWTNEGFEDLFRSCHPGGPLSLPSPSLFTILALFALCIIYACSKALILHS
jgi:hypothetical protein